MLIMKFQVGCCHCGFKFCRDNIQVANYFLYGALPSTVDVSVTSRVLVMSCGMASYSPYGHMQREVSISSSSIKWD